MQQKHKKDIQLDQNIWSNYFDKKIVRTNYFFM